MENLNRTEVVLVEQNKEVTAEQLKNDRSTISK